MDGYCKYSGIAYLPWRRYLYDYFEKREVDLSSYDIDTFLRWAYHQNWTIRDVWIEYEISQ